MSPIRATLAFAIVLIGLPAAATQPTGRVSGPRLFTVINATADSVTALAVAPVGSGAFAELSLDPPLQGGLSDITVRLPDGDCLRDVRVTFRNGTSSTLAGIDVCRGHGLRLDARARSGSTGGPARTATPR